MTHTRIPRPPIKAPPTSAKAPQQTRPVPTNGDHAADRLANDAEDMQSPPHRLPVPDGDPWWLTKIRKRWDDPVPVELLDASNGEPAPAPAHVVPAARHAAAQAVESDATDAAPAVASAAPAVQLQAALGDAVLLPASDVHVAAAAGIRDAGAPLPHGDRIQRAFGPDHDLSQVTAHIGGAATAAAAQLGATAYATGEHIAFASAPDLRLAAHEAAHVVQQRSGVALSGGIGRPGDAYERHAEAVASAVVDGKAAAVLLDQLPGGGASIPSHQAPDTGPRTIQCSPVVSGDTARFVGSGSPHTTSAGWLPAADESRELLVAEQESLRLEAGGAPSVARYKDLLAAVLAAQRLTDRAPDDPAVSARVTQLLQPVAHRLDQLNDHQGRLRRFGAGNLAGQVALDMSQAAIESWLRRLKLGATIHTNELVTKFRAGAETIRFLTGERADAPTLRGFDAASRATVLGAAGLALAPVLLAEAAPLLASAAAIPTRSVVLWALRHPAAALAASEALFALGVQLGEDGWQTFWDQLHDPRGRWFVLAQVLMDYLHIRSGMHGGGTPAPSRRRSSVPTGTELPPSRVPAQATAGPLPDLESGAAPDIAGARERVARLRAIVERVRDDASAARETAAAAVPSSPSHSNVEHAPSPVDDHAPARGSSTHTTPEAAAQARKALADARGDGDAAANNTNRPLTRRPFRNRDGTEVDAVEHGRAVVPTGKIELYPRGKAKPFTKEMADELKALKQQRQHARKEFDNDPSKATRIEDLERLSYNQQRSREMARSLKGAGLSDTPAVNDQIIRHLLHVGQQITEANRVRYPSEIAGRTGKVKLLSTWVILPDGRALLVSINVIPQ